MLRKDQSLVYYHKTDLLYNLAKAWGSQFELHLNCPHINQPQIIVVNKDEVEMVEDVNDPFDPADYGFIPDAVMGEGEETWIEDWTLKRKVKEDDSHEREFNIYLNGFLFYHIFEVNFPKIEELRGQTTIFFGRIPSRTEGDIIMKNIGFKRVKQ